MNNKSIALNILRANEQKISPYYKSEFNKTRENKTLLIITDDNNLKRQHYLAVKKLNALLKKRQVIVEIIV